MPHQISNLAADMLATQCNGQAKFSGPDWWGPSTWELGDYPPSCVGSICVEIWMGRLTNGWRVSSNYTTYILVSPSCNIPTNNILISSVALHRLAWDPNSNTPSPQHSDSFREMKQYYPKLSQRSFFELSPVSQRQGPFAQLQRIRWDHLMDCQQSHQNIHTLDILFRRYSFHHRCRLHHPSASIFMRYRIL